MARPKKDTKEGELATIKWKETMRKRYGGNEGVKKMMQKMGSKGGKISRGGGFAANPELARIAGSKGGKISRRNSGPWDKVWYDKKEDILRFYEMGVPMTRIADMVKMPHGVLRYRLKKEENDTAVELPVEKPVEELTFEQQHIKYTLELDKELERKQLRDSKILWWQAGGEE